MEQTLRVLQVLERALFQELPFILSLVLGEKFEMK